MSPSTPRRPRGFTLVEMLVVIAIIGVLMAILVPTLYRVVIKGRQTKIAQELNLLHQAIEQYKQKFGDYPPDFTTLTAADVAPATFNPNHLVVRHLRKAFGRHTEDLNAAFKDPSGTSFNKPDPAEALVFWLSLLWEDPRRPLTGTGKRMVLFTFDEKRLADPDGDGLPVYLPPEGKDAPYVYFDSRIYTDARPISSTITTPIASLCVYNDPATGTPLLYPYASKLKNEPVSVTNPLVMANKTTFQIISGGLDGDYGEVTSVTAGDPTTYKVFPFSDNYQKGDLDNIANFSLVGEKVIFEDHLE